MMALGHGDASVPEAVHQNVCSQDFSIVAHEHSGLSCRPPPHTFSHWPTGTLPCHHTLGRSKRRFGVAAQLRGKHLTGLATGMVDALLPSLLWHRRWCADSTQLAAMVSGRTGGCGLLRLQRDRRPMLQLRQPALRLSDMSCCLQA